LHDTIHHITIQARYFFKVRQVLCNRIIAEAKKKHEGNDPFHALNIRFGVSAAKIFLASAKSNINSITYAYG
jgi:hypothetical protein